MGSIERPIPVPGDLFVVSSLLGATELTQPPTVGIGFGLDLDKVDGPPTCERISMLEPLPDHPGGVDNVIAWMGMLPIPEWNWPEVADTITFALGVQVTGDEVLLTVYSVLSNGRNQGRLLISESVEGTADHPKAAARVPLAALDGQTEIALDGPIYIGEGGTMPLLKVEHPRLTLQATADGYEGLVGGAVDPLASYVKRYGFCKGTPSDVNRAHPEIPGGLCDGSSVGLKFEAVPGTLGGIVEIDAERDTCP